MRRWGWVLALIVPAFASASALRAQEKPSPVQRKLAETKITHEFKETPLDEAVRLIASKAGVNILVDPHAEGRKPLPPDHRGDGKRRQLIWVDDIKVTQDARGMKASDLLHRLADPFDLEVSVREELVLIGSPSRKRTRFAYQVQCVQPGVPAKVGQALRGGKPLSARFDDVPLPALLKELAERAGRKIRLDTNSEYLLLQPMTIKLKDVSLAGWLEALCCIADATWTVEGEDVLITDRMRPIDIAIRKWMEEKKVSLKLDKKPIFESLDMLRFFGRAPITPDPECFDEDYPGTLTLKMQDVSLREACDRMSLETGLQCVVRDGLIRFVDDETLRKIDVPRRPVVPIGRRNAEDVAAIMKLHWTNNTVSCGGNYVQEFGDFVALLAEINFATLPQDFADDHRVCFLGDGVNCDTMLDMIPEQTDLEWTVLDGVVCVGKRKELQRWATAVYDTLEAKPADVQGRSLFKALRTRRVTFSFDNTDADEALEFIADKGGLKIEMDDSVYDYVVTLKLKDVRLGTALNLFCRNTGLRWEHLPGTSKIRFFAEEE